MSVQFKKMSHREEDVAKSPAWHKDALREAERLVNEGKAKFSNWKEAKQRIRRQAVTRS